MLQAFGKSIIQIVDPTTRKILGLSLLITVICFVLFWSIFSYLFINFTIFHIEWLETAADTIGSLAIILVSWFLFPGVFSAAVSLFLNRK